MNKTKKAFTMAEVLVVVLILGVIAALTIPSLMRDHRKRINITNAKKAEYDVHQIAMRLQAECPRLRDASCSNGTVQSNLEDLLEAASKDKVTFSNDTLQVNVAINGEQNSLQYTLNANGSVTPLDNKSAHAYICGKYENEKECEGED